MDMMAMAVLFDMASRNRHWDERFEPRPQSRSTNVAKSLLAKIFRKRQSPETHEDYAGTWAVSCAGGAK